MEISNKTALNIITVFTLLILICFAAIGVGYIGSTKLPQSKITATINLSESTPIDILQKNNDSHPVPTFIKGSKEKLSSNEMLQNIMYKQNVTIVAREVQFDMLNNINKEFGLSGTGELSDYYNYGYNRIDIKEDFFCIHVTPFDGNFSDSWHIYFRRGGVYSQLYQHLLEGEIDIFLTAKVLESLYEDGQGNMAIGIYAEWFK